ncbi:MAG: 50S ribosomal protein L25 [Deltaproteobacteria bacterium]|nr:50S ribosomal protein L25 [Deltaproteobacteria bacterium]
MDQQILTARSRDKKGKEAAKKFRKNGLVPAIFYSPNTDPVMLTVEDLDLRKIMRQTAGENAILELQIESDKGKDSKTVMLKELQTDPIKDTYIHADFYEISMDREVTLDIPIRLINTPIGIANEGMLQHVRREISVSCMPDKLVDFIELDVSELDIGDSLHVSDIVFPEGISSTQDDNLTVAAVLAPTVVEEEEPEAEEEGVEEEGVEEEGAEKKGTGEEEAKENERG